MKSFFKIVKKNYLKFFKLKFYLNIQEHKYILLKIIT